MVVEKELSLSTEEVQNRVSWISYQEQTLCILLTFHPVPQYHIQHLFSPLSNNACQVGSLSTLIINSGSGGKDSWGQWERPFFPFCTPRIAASLLPLQLLSALHQKFCLHTPLPACKPPTVFPAVHTTPSTAQARPPTTCACQKSDLLHIKPDDFQCLQVPIKT